MRWLLLLVPVAMAEVDDVVARVWEDGVGAQANDMEHLLARGRGGREESVIATLHPAVRGRGNWLIVQRARMDVAQEDGAVMRMSRARAATVVALYLLFFVLACAWITSWSAAALA